MTFKNWIHEILRDFGYLIPAAIGGLVDYLNQLQRGCKKWSFKGFIGHMLSAWFFGWLAGTIISGFGYGSDFVAASGGMGGFLGVRLADLIVYKVFKVERRDR